MVAKLNNWRVALRIMCAIALLALGFSHKMPVVAAAPSEAQVAAYVLPDGTLPELCLPDADGTHKTSKYQLGSGCDACRITASILLPAPADTVGAPLRTELAVVLPFRVEAFYRQLFPPNAAPRAPPSDPHTA
ncbi:MAG: hypothetical protein ACOH2J_09470 [Allorhizobium sp.]